MFLDFIEVAGVALLVIGLGLVALPLGLVTAGLFLVVAANAVPPGTGTAVTPKGERVGNGRR